MPRGVLPTYSLIRISSQTRINKLTNWTGSYLKVCLQGKMVSRSDTQPWWAMTRQATHLNFRPEWIQSGPEVNTQAQPSCSLLHLRKNPLSFAFEDICVIKIWSGQLEKFVKKKRTVDLERKNSTEFLVFCKVSNFSAVTGQGKYIENSCKRRFAVAVLVPYRQTKALASQYKCMVWYGYVEYLQNFLYFILLYRYQQTVLYLTTTVPVPGT